MVDQSPSSSGENEDDIEENLNMHRCVSITRRRLTILSVPETWSLGGVFVKFM